MTGNGLSCHLWQFNPLPRKPNPRIPNWDDYTISLFVEDSLGCFDSAQTFITLPLNIYVPNAFTPNNDEHNNVFEIKRSVE